MHWFKFLSFAALFRCMTLCHYASTKLLEEEKLTEGCSVSHWPHFFRKLNYLPNINSCGGSHCHREQAPSPTRYEHQAELLKCPIVLPNPYPKALALHLLLSQDRFSTPWQILILPALSFSTKRLKIQIKKLDSKRCKIQWKMFKVHLFKFLKCFK